MTESLPPPGADKSRGLGRFFPPPDEPGAPAKMLIGLLGGVAVSAAVWGLFLDRMGAAVIAAVVGAKVLAGIGCLATRRWRPLGQGVLASIAVGALIFVWKLCSGVGV